MKRAVLSLSGGMDSTCLLIDLLASGYEKVKAIGFNYGQKHQRELQLAKKNVDLLRKKGFNVTYDIIDLTTVTKLFQSSALVNNDLEVPTGHYEDPTMSTTIVPNRNMILASIVFGVALSWSQWMGGEYVDIALGMHSGDDAVYPDCRPESIEAVQKALFISNDGSDKISYIAPYIKGNKETILLSCLKSCQKLELDFDTILSNTLTSYNPDKEGRSAGNTGSDIERIEAFIAIGRKDPISYIKPWEEIKNNAMAILGL